MILISDMKCTVNRGENYGTVMEKSSAPFSLERNQFENYFDQRYFFLNERITILLDIDEPLLFVHSKKGPYI